jgi:hypothetical protein
MVSRQVLDAFHMMWGPFPEPVFLLHKSREILAVNEAGQAAGIPVGVKCSSLNPENTTDSHCKQCKAVAALRQGQPMTSPASANPRRMRGYWLPLKDVEDVYVHFGVSIGDEIDEALAAAGKI